MFINWGEPEQTPPLREVQLLCLHVDIRQHDSAVYVEMVVVVCIPYIIQQKSSTSILQGLKAATTASKEKVLTMYQTALTVHPCQHAPAQGKRPRHILHFVFFF